MYTPQDIEKILRDSAIAAEAYRAKHLELTAPAGRAGKYTAADVENILSQSAQTLPTTSELYRDQLKRQIGTDDAGYQGPTSQGGENVLKQSEEAIPTESELYWERLKQYSNNARTRYQGPTARPIYGDYLAQSFKNYGTGMANQFRAVQGTPNATDKVLRELLERDETMGEDTSWADGYATSTAQLLNPDTRTLAFLNDKVARVREMLDSFGYASSGQARKAELERYLRMNGVNQLEIILALSSYQGKDTSWAEGDTPAAQRLRSASQAEQEAVERIRENTQINQRDIAALREKYKDAGDPEKWIAENVVMSGGQMLPSLALGFVPYVGQALALGSIGLSTAGNATGEALVSRADFEQARTYGTMSGVSEVAIEGLFGGIAKLAGGIIPTGKLVDLFVKSEAGQYLVKRLVDVTGEGAEEVISEYISPLLKRMTYDPDAKLPTGQDLADAWGGGAVVSAVLGIPANVKALRLPDGSNRGITKADGAAPLGDAGVSDFPAAGTGKTKLYRVMSDAEYQSIINNEGKFSKYDRAMEEKWFAATPEDAAKWAGRFYPDGRYRMIEIEMPTDSLNQMYQVRKLDGIGPAYSGGIDFLNSVMKGLKLR